MSIIQEGLMIAAATVGSIVLIVIVLWIGDHAFGPVIEGFIKWMRGKDKEQAATRAGFVLGIAVATVFYLTVGHTTGCY